MDLAGLLTTRVGLPVVLDNDVNTLVANEKWFGAGRGVDDVAVVSIGRGVGLGLVLDGRLYRGSAGGAGEFGHTKVRPDGPVCACGGQGCLEALIGEPALRAQASAVLGRDRRPGRGSRRRAAGKPSRYKRSSAPPGGCSARRSATW